MQNVLFRIITFIIFVLVVIGSSFPPLSAEEICSEARLRDLGIAIVNCIGNTGAVCSTSGTVPGPASPGLGAGSKIYVLGDSIANSAKSNLQTEITAAGFVVSGINTDPGRAITYDSAGGDPTGLQAVAADGATIAGSDAIVIELGTNSGNEDLNLVIPQLISSVRSSNPTAPIYWVNVFATSPRANSVSRNQAISSQAIAQGYTIIDATTAGIQLGTDQVHPTTGGNTTFASFVIKSLAASNNTASGATRGAYDPISLGFPIFPNESIIASRLTEYIRLREPDSPWLSISQDIGGWLVKESKSRNINPLLIAAIGKQENNFGTTKQKHVKDYYNYFGMKGSSPIDIPGSDYRGFSSPIEGMLFFMDKVKSNTQGPDKGLYVNVANFYDYLGMHQAGQIKYPGESLGSFNNGIDGYDPSMKVYISWTTSDHPNNAYDGQLFNPGIYYKNSINMVNDLTGLSLATIPTRGPTSGTPAQCTGESSTAAGQNTKFIDGFTIYSQTDPEWANNQYGVGINADGKKSTIGSDGCGPSAMAMIITALTGRTVTPAQTAAFGMLPGSKTYSKDGGSEGVALATLMAQNWGLKATFIGSSEARINDTLRAGGLVIVGGRGGLPFTTGGHFVVIRAVTENGKWLVGDSSHSNVRPSTSSTEYDPQTMIADFAAGGYSSYAITK